jgi:hypothetical protein
MNDMIEEPIIKPDIVSYLANLDYVDAMEPKERKKFLASAAKVYREVAFIRVIDELCSKAACYAIMNGVENAKAAATINVFQEIKKRFGALSAAFEQETAGKEGFDPHGAV